MHLGAIILAGGASSRMGADKALQLWNGERAVDRLYVLAKALGAEPVIVSGGDYGLPFAPDPSGPHGPAAGVAAGCAVLKSAGAAQALILAVDAPTLTAEDLAPLLAAPRPGACYFGLPLPMVIDIAALPPDLLPGWPLRRVVERAGLHVLPPPHGAQLRLRGANTTAELEALRKAPKT